MNRSWILFDGNFYNLKTATSIVNTDNGVIIYWQGSSVPVTKEATDTLDEIRKYIMYSRVAYAPDRKAKK